MDSEHSLKSERRLTHRKIIHVDMDAFYASVEQRDDPALRGRPVIVGGSPTGRGVVSAASYEARKWGIHSAMPSRTAFKRCPQAVFVRGDFSKYRAVSKEMRGILNDYTSIVEPVSLDECYLDVTELPVPFSTATSVAQEIKRRIKDELHLTASAGVAPFKYVAKIASDYNKPDGLTVVHPDRVLEFLHPLSISKIPGVGPVTLARLNSMDVFKIGDVAKWSLEEARDRLGKHGVGLWRMANGIENKRVRTSWKRKSKSAERTFAEDIPVRSQMISELTNLAYRVSTEISKQHLVARTVKIKVRYSDFTTLTRSSTLMHPTDDPAIIADVAVSLLKSIEHIQPVRLLGVGVASLVYPDTPRQLHLGL